MSTVYQALSIKGLKAKGILSLNILKFCSISSKGFLVLLYILQVTPKTHCICLSSADNEVWKMLALELKTTKGLLRQAFYTTFVIFLPSIGNSPPDVSD